MNWSRVLCTMVLLLVGSAAHAADEWGKFTIISSTLGNNAGRLCAGAPSTMRPGDVGCPTYAPSLTTAGDVSITGNVSANKFIGDGSGITGVTASSSDRITSGTTSFIVISNTGYISLTQSGTNTGWFSPYTGLVTLGVSSTGGISGTTGYYSGNVGIGTTSPSNTLHLVGTAKFTSTATNAGNGYIGLGLSGNNNYPALSIGTSAGTETFKIVSAGDWRVGTPSSTPLSLVTSNKQRLYIDTAGNVGISNTVPLARLDVNGTISASDAIQIGSSSLGCSSGIQGALRYNSGTMEFCDGSSWTNVASSGGGAVQDRIVSGSTNVIANTGGGISFTTAGTQRMAIATGGNVGIGTASPTAKLEVNSGNIRVGYARSTADAQTGAIEFQNDYWNVPNLFASIEARTNTGTYTHGSSELAFSTRDAGTLGERMRIASNGNIGIGTITPTATLQVSGSLIVSTTGQTSTPSLYVGTDGNVAIGLTDPSAYVYAPNFVVNAGAGDGGITVKSGTAGTGRIHFADGTTGNEAYRGIIQYNHSNDSMQFATTGAGGGAYRMTIDSTGNVGVGTTDPSATLDVSGTIKMAGTGSEGCTTANLGTMRYNPSSKAMEICMP